MDSYTLVFTIYHNYFAKFILCHEQKEGTKFEVVSNYFSLHNILRNLLFHRKLIDFVSLLIELQIYNIQSVTKVCRYVLYKRFEAVENIFYNTSNFYNFLLSFQSIISLYLLDILFINYYKYRLLLLCGIE